MLEKGQLLFECLSTTADDAHHPTSAFALHAQGLASGYVSTSHELSHLGLRMSLLQFLHLLAKLFLVLGDLTLFLSWCSSSFFDGSFRLSFAADQ